MDEQLSALTAALADRYNVEKQVGEGGMATVYLARDLKHGRPVAIKVLRPELSASVGTDRFLREIEMAARLQHPHILPVYDSGAAGSLLYYVMPFVEGESLRERLDRDGALPVDEAVRLATEVASALDYANSHGVIHRDIKPENILLFGGHAVVADFGVARAVESSGGAGLTGMGIAIGTPAYMSPEQATATSEMDGRSDQYSLAAVVFEMLTGSRAFGGNTVQAVMTKSISGPRPRVRELRSDIPGPTDSAIVRALSQDPAERFASSTEFARALDAHGSGAYEAVVRGSRRRLAVAALLVVALGAALVWALNRGPQQVVEGAERIAVMPFRTTGAGVDVLSEGLVDLLSTNLDGVGGVRTVEPRSVLSRVKERGGEPDLDTALEIGRDLGASAVLLGSVIETGRSVRLSADLYGADGRKLGHAQVDGAADSVLTLVDALSLSLMREVWRSNEPIPSLRVAGLTTTSLLAMRDYLRGEQFYRASQWDSAASAYKAAIAADSTFALAQYRLAMTYGWQGNVNGQEAGRAGEAAVRFAERLPANERALVQAYRLFQRGQVSATDSMLKYTAANPDDPDGWYLLGESRYHTRSLRASTPAELREPFDRVLALDSSLTPAAIHPLEVTLETNDRASFDRYMRVLERANAEGELERFRPAEAMVFGRQRPDSLFDRVVESARGDVLMSTMLGLTAGAPPEQTIPIVQQLTSAFPERANVGAMQMQAMFLAGLGRMDAAEGVVARAPPNSEDRIIVALVPLFAGFASERYVDSISTELRAIVQRAPPPDSVAARFQMYMRSLFLLSIGDAAAAKTFIDRGKASRAGPAFLDDLFIAAEGWYHVARGDTLAGLRQMSQGVDGAGWTAGSFLTAPVRFARAKVMASIPSMRDEGLRQLRYGFTVDQMMQPMATLAAARAERSAGRLRESADLYSSFLESWRGADAEYQPLVTQVRQELSEVQRSGG